MHDRGHGGRRPGQCGRQGHGRHSSICCLLGPSEPCLDTGVLRERSQNPRCPGEAGVKKFEAEEWQAAVICQPLKNQAVILYSCVLIRIMICNFNTN